MQPEDFGYDFRDWVSHYTKAAREFTREELALVKPVVTIALGRLTASVLSAVGVNCVGLPHPAARIGSVAAHEAIWRSVLGNRMGVVPAA